MTDEPQPAHGGPLDGCLVESDRPGFCVQVTPDRLAMYERQADGSYRYAGTATPVRVTVAFRDPWWKSKAIIGAAVAVIVAAAVYFVR